jgi:NitT/TauT family transport system substrate-binding protein
MCVPVERPPPGRLATVTGNHHSGGYRRGHATGSAHGHVPGWGLREREFTEAQMNTRSSRMNALIGAAIMIISAGCSAANGATSAAVPPPEEADVTVAAIPAVDLAGLYIAQDRGLFARQGLNVRIEPIPSAQSVIADQLKGKVDISAGSYVAYIAAQAAGARFRILAEASTLAPNTRALVVTAHSRVTTIAALTGQKIGVNGVNSIGTLLISALLSARGISPAKVKFVADPGGFPALPGKLQAGDWAAAFLAEPYITAAGQKYGDQVLADLDQGAVINLPVDGYVAARAWAQRHPRTAAAFIRAIEQGQAIANHDVSAVQAIMAQNDKLPPPVTAAMALPATYPVGPVAWASIQRVATAMLTFGVLGPQYAARVRQGTLVRSMIGPGS